MKRFLNFKHMVMFKTVFYFELYFFRTLSRLLPDSFSVISLKSFVCMCAFYSEENIVIEKYRFLCYIVYILPVFAPYRHGGLSASALCSRRRNIFLFRSEPTDGRGWWMFQIDPHRHFEQIIQQLFMIVLFQCVLRGIFFRLS